MTIHVKASSTASSPTGDSWSTAFSSLAAALAAFHPYEDGHYEFWVAQGVYTPGTTRGSAFHLHDRAALYGGFAGTEARREERDWQAHPTILSGDVEGNDEQSIFTDNAFHVVRAHRETAGEAAIIDGFVIRGGRDVESSPPAGGNATGAAPASMCQTTPSPPCAT